MKNFFYITYLICLMFIVVAAEAINAFCHLTIGKKPIKMFEL